MARLPTIGGMRDRAANAVWKRARSGNGIWLGVAIVASGVKLLAKWSRRERKVVYRGSLAPGERLVIRHLSHDHDAEG